MHANQVRKYFQERLGQQPGTKIQYGHPSPRFWKKTELDLAEVRAMRNKDRKLMLSTGQFNAVRPAAPKVAAASPR